MRPRFTPVALAVATASAVVLGACARATVTSSPLADAPRRPAVHPDSVVVYRRANDVPGPYAEVALVSARGDFTVVSDGAVVRALRKEAGRLGANGLLLAGVQAPHGVAKVAGVLYGGPLASREGQAVAILVARDTAARDSTVRR